MELVSVFGIEKIIKFLKSEERASLREEKGLYRCEENIK